VDIAAERDNKDLKLENIILYHKSSFTNNSVAKLPVLTCLLKKLCVYIILSLNLNI